MLVMLCIYCPTSWEGYGKSLEDAPCFEHQNDDPNYAITCLSLSLSTSVP